MNVQIHPSWKSTLEPEFKQLYFQDLVEFVRHEYDSHTCYPPGKEIFAAFDACPLDQVKVVIIGQDPYHGVGQAHGLCFSVNDGISHPPSLINIFKEQVEDLGKSYPDSGSLIPWAAQGVLLLNSTLTVRAHEAGSHQGKGWEAFTDAVIAALSDQKEQLVFMLWGGYAKKKGKKIDRTKHLVLETGHPSPLSANRGYWFGNKHFSKANAYLKENDLGEIKW